MPQAPVPPSSHQPAAVLSNGLAEILGTRILPDFKAANLPGTRVTQDRLVFGGGPGLRKAFPMTGSNRYFQCCNLKHPAPGNLSSLGLSESSGVPEISLARVFGQDQVFLISTASPFALPAGIV